MDPAVEFLSLTVDEAQFCPPELARLLALRQKKILLTCGRLLTCFMGWADTELHLLLAISSTHRFDRLVKPQETFVNFSQSFHDELFQKCGKNNFLLFCDFLKPW